MSKKTPEGKIITDDEWAKARELFVKTIDLLADANHRTRHEAFIAFGLGVLGFDALVVVSASKVDGGAELETDVKITREISPACQTIASTLRHMARGIEQSAPANAPQVVQVYDSAAPGKRGQA